MQKLAYSVDEARKTLGISRRKIYYLIGEGDLVARKIGRRTLITAVDLQKYLDSLPRYKKEGRD